MGADRYRYPVSRQVLMAGLRFPWRNPGEDWRRRGYLLLGARSVVPVYSPSPSG